MRISVKGGAGPLVPTGGGMHHGGETRLYETDDLIQAGYLALADAVQGYDPDAGMVFGGMGSAVPGVA